MTDHLRVITLGVSTTFNTIDLEQTLQLSSFRLLLLEVSSQPLGSVVTNLQQHRRVIGSL
jgi:hypothetical protein